MTDPTPKLPRRLPDVPLKPEGFMDWLDEIQDGMNVGLVIVGVVVVVIGIAVIVGVIL